MPIALLTMLNSFSFKLRHPFESGFWKSGNYFCLDADLEIESIQPHERGGMYLKMERKQKSRLIGPDEQASKVSNAEIT
jgi:hypothetical protein